MPRIRAKGFTLVELLVVIGIIAILIGILLPALSKARAQANQIKCASNLRTIGQGLAIYLANYNQFYPASYSYYGQTVNGGTETPPYAINGYVHWSSFIYGRRDQTAPYPQAYMSTVGWEAFQCPSINNGGLPADEPSLNNKEPDQNLDPANGSNPNAPDYQAPRLAYTANEAIMGRNKYVVNFQGGNVRIYQFVRASQIRRSAATILVTEFNEDWHVVNDYSDEDGSTIVCKSHRPVCPYMNIVALGSPGAYKVDLAGNLSGANLIRVHISNCTPYPNINAPGMGQTVTSLDWVGRNHGPAHRLGTVNWTLNGKPQSTSGWDMGTTNFLYCDGHVENKNLAETLGEGDNWEWGDYMYSLVPGNDIRD